jgi:tetratricopeptide (TPR) repeat protein
MGFFDRLFGKKQAPPPNTGPKIDKLFAQAKALSLAGEFQRAVVEFAKMLELAPGHAEGRYAYARALARSGDRAKAAEELIESIRLSGEVEDPAIILQDAEKLGIAFSQAQLFQIAAGLTAGLAEGRFVLLHEEPFDEDDPPICPEGFLQSVAYRQIRDGSPFEASLSIMKLKATAWKRRDEATALLGEQGLDAFLQKFESSVSSPRFLTCYKLTDLRKFLRRAAQNPIRGTDELFYDPKSVAIIDPLRRSIPLLEERPIEESVLKWFAYQVTTRAESLSEGDLPFRESHKTEESWPDKRLVNALAEAYQKNDNEARARLAIKRLSIGT